MLAGYLEPVKDVGGFSLIVLIYFHCLVYPVGGCQNVVLVEEEDPVLPEDDGEDDGDEDNSLETSEVMDHTMGHAVSMVEGVGGDVGGEELIGQNSIQLGLGQEERNFICGVCTWSTGRLLCGLFDKTLCSVLTNECHQNPS